MSDNKTELQLNLPELVNLAAKLLHRIFLDNPKDKARPIFKEIKSGTSVPLGQVTIDGQLTSDLALALDYSEFKGPGFNFDVFKTALVGILHQISEQFASRRDLNVMTSDEGTMLLHLPGMVEVSGQLNVLVMAFELANINNIVVKLMFLEPDQYEPYRRAAEGD